MRWLIGCELGKPHLGPDWLVTGTAHEQCTYLQTATVHRKHYLTLWGHSKVHIQHLVLVHLFAVSVFRCLRFECRAGSNERAAVVNGVLPGTMIFAGSRSKVGRSMNVPFSVELTYSACLHDAQH